MIPPTAARSPAWSLDDTIAEQKAWLEDELEKIGHEIREPSTEATYPRDIDIKLGDTWLDHTSVFSIDATSGKTEVSKDIYPVMNWGHVLRNSFIDVQNDMRCGRGLPRYYVDKGVTTNWHRSLDYVTYRGWKESPGLFNHPDIQRFDLPRGIMGSSRWKDKTPGEILFDTNMAIVKTHAASNFDLTGMADTLLIPPDAYESAKKRKLIEWLLKENLRTKTYGKPLRIFASAWAEGIGKDGANRILAYCRNEDRVYLDIPVVMQKIMTQPFVQNGGQLLTLFLSQLGVVKFLFKSCVAYYDGV